MQLGNAPGNIVDYINKTFSFNIGKISIAPTYWQAGAILFLIFLLVLSLARLRHMYVGWSLKGFVPNLLLGFFLALIVEGFLIISGRTLLTSLVGWENAPKPISTAIDEAITEKRKQRIEKCFSPKTESKAETKVPGHLCVFEKSMCLSHSRTLFLASSVDTVSHLSKRVHKPPIVANQEPK